MGGRNGPESYRGQEQNETTIENLIGMVNDYLKAGNVNDANYIKNTIIGIAKENLTQEDFRNFRDSISERAKQETGQNKRRLYELACGFFNSCGPQLPQGYEQQQNGNGGSPVIINNNNYIQVPNQQQPKLEQNDGLPNVINMHILSGRLYGNGDISKDYNDRLVNSSNIQISKGETKTISLRFESRTRKLTIIYGIDGVIYFSDDRGNKADYYIDLNDDDMGKSLIFGDEVPDGTHGNYMKLNFRLNLDRQRHFQQPIGPGGRRYHGNPRIQGGAEEFYGNQFRSR